MPRLPRTVLRDEVKELVMERILEGTYVPGERIIESALAQEFGVSQAPVREALRDLEAIRMVESEPYRGSRVREVSLDELAEIYPVRAALEEVAGRAAAQRVDPEFLLALRSELTAMRTAAANGHPHEQMAHDVAFHRRILQQAGNTILLEVWSGLRIEARTMLTFLHGREDLVLVADSHQPLLAVFESGEPDAAGRAMRDHISYYGRKVEEQLRDRSSA